MGTCLLGNCQVSQIVPLSCSAQAPHSIALIRVPLLLSACHSVLLNTREVNAVLLAPLQLALARCVSDGQCLENLVCLQLCNGRKDEAACQVLPLSQTCTCFPAHAMSCLPRLSGHMCIELAGAAILARHCWEAACDS